ncbi:MAG: PAM68 family protein [Synechococcaceae cyanobacterium]|nr:PAM68 family protein [Synechococcaceae cyanobacterium]
MGRQRHPGSFAPGEQPDRPSGSAGRPAASRRPATRTTRPSRPTGAQVIPEPVAQRMMRRIAIATGIPSLLGMAVFVGSYLLVSRQLLDIPPVATLLASGGCFLLGLLGLSYGVLSASWESAPGSLLGVEQLGVNISRVRGSIRAMRQGSTPSP